MQGRCQQAGLEHRRLFFLSPWPKIEGLTENIIRAYIDYGSEAKHPTGSQYTISDSRCPVDDLVENHQYAIYCSLVNTHLKQRDKWENRGHQCYDCFVIVEQVTPVCSERHEYRAAI
jgi:hypothetical protein